MKFILTILSVFVFFSAEAQNWQQHIVQYSSSGLDSRGGADVIDFDGDGLNDVLIGFEQRPELLLIRDNNFHKLQIEMLTDTLYGYSYIKTTDFNSDGFDDFIIRVYGFTGQQLWVCINDGNYNYSWQFIGDMDSAFFQSLEIADLDGDNDKDIVIDYEGNDGALFIYENIDDTLFNFSLINLNGPGVTLFGIADLDNNSVPDLLAANFSFTDNLYHLKAIENDGDMNWTIHESTFILPGARNGTIGNFNPGIFPDVIISTATGTGNAVKCMNNEDFTFTLSVYVPVSDYSSLSKVLDYDNDGDDDFFASYNGDVSIVLQNENGSFSQVTLISGTYGNVMAYMDMDNDGNKDIVLGGNTSAIEIYRNSGPNSFERYFENYMQGTGHLIVEDVDNNGNKDIVTANYGGQVTNFKQLFNELIDYPAVDTISAANIDALTIMRQMLQFDKEGDGDIDLLCYISDHLFWLINTNGNYVAQLINSDGNGTDLWVGFLDNDANHDILTFTSQLTRYEWNGTGYTETLLSTQTSDNFTVADADQDGDNDVIYIGADFNSQTNQLGFLRNDAGVFTNQFIMTLPALFSDNFFNANNNVRFTNNDIDMDNDPDLFINSPMTDQFIWFRNDGDLIFVPDAVSTILDNPQQYGITDMDGDSDKDIVISNRDDKEIVLFTNDGNENFSLTVLSDMVAAPECVVLADMDNDNDEDVVFSSIGDRRIGWLENTLIDCQRTYSYQEVHFCNGDSILINGAFYSEPGIIADTLVNAIGCDSIKSLGIMEYLPFSVSLDVTGNIIEANGGSGIFVWFRNNAIIEGETGITIDAGNYGTGSYTAMGFDLNGCSALSEPVIIDPVGIKDKYSTLSVYPNPTSGIAVFRGVDFKDIPAVSVYSSDGKRIKINPAAIKINDTNLSIDFTGIAPGVYFVSLASLQNSVVKLMIAKD